VYSKGLLRRFEKIEILIFSYIAACAASVPLLSWVEPVRPTAFAAFDWNSWAAFGFLAVFMYGVSMLLFFHVLKHIDVTVDRRRCTCCPSSGCCWRRSFLASA